MDTIPVIDIAPFLDGTAKGQAAAARAVDDACSTLGFLIIVGHGVADSLIDDMRKVSFAYFDRPIEEKIKLRMPPDRYRGYISLGSEALSYSLDEELPPDFKESFSIGPVDPPDDALSPRRRARQSSSPPISGLNSPAGFRPVWEAYYREMERVATTLMRIFAVGLGMDKHYFDDKVDRHITNFSVLHYPEQPKPPLPGQLRAGAHTDYGSLTILKPDNAPGGLQVQNRTAPGSTCRRCREPSSSTSVTSWPSGPTIAGFRRCTVSSIPRATRRSEAAACRWRFSISRTTTR